MAQYGSMTLREREDKDKRKSRKRNEGNHDSSDVSGREGKKSRKLNPLPRRFKFDKTSRAKYDQNGHEKDTGLDLCDCLIEGCPGCWMDCPCCGSRKCGHECRVYRRYKYDYVEIDGTNMTIKHPSFK